jgi:hypothetical protein
MCKEYLVDTLPTFVVVKENWNNIIHVKSCTSKEDVIKIFDTALHNMGETL